MSEPTDETIQLPFMPIHPSQQDAESLTIELLRQIERIFEDAPRSREIAVHAVTLVTYMHRDPNVSDDLVAKMVHKYTPDVIPVADALRALQASWPWWTSISLAEDPKNSPSPEH
jgi:hypothetical protein